MPRIRVLESVVGEGGEDWVPGDVKEASLSFAVYLVARGAAEPLEEIATPPLTTKAFTVADPVATHRDPVKASRKK